MEKHVRQRSSRFSPAAARCAMRHREASEGMAASISRVVQIGGKMRYILAYHNHIPGRIQILQVKVYTHIPGRKNDDDREAQRPAATLTFALPR